VRLAVIPLGRPFPVGSSDTPEGARATQPSVGLAPGGVCRAGRFPGLRVRTLTFSPVPSGKAGRSSLFCGTFPRSLGAAVSGHPCPVESGLSSGASRRQRPRDLLQPAL